MQVCSDLHVATHRRINGSRAVAHTIAKKNEKMGNNGLSNELSAKTVTYGTSYALLPNLQHAPQGIGTPKYEDMVKAAILALKDKTALLFRPSYLAANYDFQQLQEDPFNPAQEPCQVGKLLKVKASYKLGEALKKAPKKPKKKAAPKKKKATKKPKKRRPRSPRKPPRKPPRN